MSRTLKENNTNHFTWRKIKAILFFTTVHADWQAEGRVLNRNRHMFENQVDCNVTFYVGKERQIVTAHKYVLLSRSSVFHVMLCGPLQKTGPIDMADIEPGVFQHLLRFMYYEAFEPNGNCIHALLYAAKKYAVHFLVRVSEVAERCSQCQ